MKSIVARLKARGKKIVFTNGCFDILHVGHVRYLRRARKHGDILIVGLNTDRSVKQIKGEKRPIVPGKRAGRGLVRPGVCRLRRPLRRPGSPSALIESLRPNVLVKGADWPKEKIVGREVVEKTGGKVVRIPLVPGASSSGVIEKIIKAYCK